MKALSILIVLLVAPVAAWSAEPLKDPLKVGNEGTSRGCRIKVLQVFDEKTFRAEIYTEGLESRQISIDALSRMPPAKADDYIKHPPPPTKVSKSKTVFIVGIPTDNIADGDMLTCSNSFNVTGTKSYETRLGGTKTLYVLEPITVAKH